MGKKSSLKSGFSSYFIILTSSIKGTFLKLKVIWEMPERKLFNSVEVFPKRKLLKTFKMREYKMLSFTFVKFVKKCIFHEILH